jgi:hypothetical protein
VELLKMEWILKVRDPKLTPKEGPREAPSPLYCLKE